jgi:Multicopper oxidase
MPRGDLYGGLYSGQFAIVYIEPNQEAGPYDQEVFLATHEFEPFFSSGEMEEEEGAKSEDPALEAEVKADKSQKSHGWEVGYQTFTVNGRCLGHGDPIRVKEGQRVMFRILNASATETIQLALPGHEFYVVALDRNPVPRPNKVSVLQLGSKAGAPPDETIPMEIGKINGGKGGFNIWTINGQPYDQSEPIQDPRQIGATIAMIARSGISNSVRIEPRRRTKQVG